jgi:hypothetical protein
VKITTFFENLKMKNSFRGINIGGSIGPWNNGAWVSWLIVLAF